MFGLKWPWVVRQEREAAERAAREERQRNIERARDESRAFVAEQQRVAGMLRQKRLQEQNQRFTKQHEADAEAAVEDMRRQRAQSHVGPSPRPLRRQPATPTTEPTPTGTRVLWDEPMHLHLVNTPVARSDDAPAALRGGGGRFDGGGASGDWSRGDSSSSSGGDSGGDSGGGGGGGD